MALPKEQNDALDRVEQEINRVLEYTGRVFAAAKASKRSTALASSSQLRQILPGSVSSYHEALDTLDEQLQFAKMVMRRDLVVCREKAGQTGQPSGVTTDEVASNPIGVAEGPPSEANAGRAAHITQPARDAVSVSSDSSTRPLDNAVTQSNPDVDEKPAEAEAVLSDENADATEPTADKSGDVTMEDSAVDAAKSASEPDQKPTETPQLETAVDENKTADTAFSNDAEMESLFNDGTGSGDGPDFGNDIDTSNDFDLATFGIGMDADNNDGENISELLPGLQDYANDQSNGNDEPDFSTLFDTATDLQNQGVSGEQQDEGQQMDMTFDDILDFNFDVNGGGEGDGANSTNDDLNFDFS